MRLGLGLGLGRRRRAGAPAWTPADLASLSAWYEAGPAECFQDAAGTTPAAADDPVGHWRDKSGNGRHWTQTTAANRPTLRNDGTLWWVEFDATNDGLSSSFTVTVPYTLCVAAEHLTTATANTRWLNGGSGVNGLLGGLSRSDGIIVVVNSIVSIYAGADRTAPHVLALRAPAATTFTAFVDGVDRTSNAVASVSFGTLNAGAGGTNADPANARMAGAVAVAAALGDADRITLEKYLAARAGLVL